MFPSSSILFLNILKIEFIASDLHSLKYIPAALTINYLTISVNLLLLASTQIMENDLKMLIESDQLLQAMKILQQTN
jgi:hypothetical protein